MPIWRLSWINFIQNGMEKAKIKYSILHGIPTDQDYDELVTLYLELFDDADSDFFLQRIKRHPDLMTICAKSNSALIGFKMGYGILDETFYSWVGGVKTGFRKQGIAHHLAELQEDWVRENGFKTLKTKSMNRFKPMMMLNLKRGFDITKIYTNELGQTKVVFKKSLS